YAALRGRYPRGQREQSVKLLRELRWFESSPAHRNATSSRTPARTAGVLREIADMQNDEQFDYWNGPEGQHWVDWDTTFDAMLGGFVEPLLDAAAITYDDRILDVGCGNGAVSRAAARRALNGRVVGVDISALMLERARARAVDEGLDNVEFV